jgi:hypothetical protein
MTSFLWEYPTDHSLEYFQFRVEAHEIVLQGTVILLLEGLPARISYRIVCDPNWHTRAAAIFQDYAGEHKELTLQVNDKQAWLVNDVPATFADGLYDLDLEISPSTNTLAIRRLGLKDGESGETTPVWVRFPSLTLEALPQKYTRLDAHTYEFNAPTQAFTAQLSVDDSALVVKYGDLWQRVETSGILQNQP